VLFCDLQLTCNLIRKKSQVGGRIGLLCHSYTGECSCLLSALSQHIWQEHHDHSTRKSHSTGVGEALLVSNSTKGLYSFVSFAYFFFCFVKTANLFKDQGLLVSFFFRVTVAQSRLIVWKCFGHVLIAKENKN
jgi:hypothetical protein